MAVNSTPFIALDNVLSKTELDNFYEGLKNFDINPFRYVEDNELDTWNDIKFVHPLLKILSKYFNIKRRYRYELWQHLGTYPQGWHFDKDEILYKKKIFEHPLFGLIYYPLVESLHGGELLLETGISVTPKSNRLVLFSTGKIRHNVEKYEGYRHSFLINIWDKKKLG